ncbi:MAG: hypothetical protein HQK87_04275 [Nitrospinae bacterium]|nr:hypothetical protein [Nitrospinota bacterium]
MADQEIERFVAQYDRVAELMAQASEAIPPGEELFRPHPRCQEWLYLLTHPATHFEIFRTLMEGGADHGFPTAYRAPENLPANGPAGGRLLRERWSAFRHWIVSRPEGFAATMVKVPWGGAPMTVAQLLDWLYEEGVHHRGQAWVYARMHDMKPPAIWGTEG